MVLIFRTLERRIHIVVVDVTNLDSVEVEPEILKTHPECSIVLSNPVQFNFDFRSPLLAMVTPVSVPFKVTPRVPKFNQLYLFIKDIPHLSNV